MNETSGSLLQFPMENGPLSSWFTDLPMKNGDFPSLCGITKGYW